MTENSDSDIEMEEICEDGEIKKNSPNKNKGGTDSSSSASEEDTADNLEIKPPQALVHKSTHRQRDKHSSSRRHGPSTSEHRKRHHHSRSHREERRRHHRERAAAKEEAVRKQQEELRREEARRVQEAKVKEEKAKEERAKQQEEMRQSRERELELRERLERKRERSGAGKSDRDKERQERRERLLESDRPKEVYKKEEDGKDDMTRDEERMAQEDEIRRSREKREAELRERLEKKRLEQSGQLKPEREKERQERDRRRQRLLEAERVKATYKKNTEERRLRREERDKVRIETEKTRERSREQVQEMAIEDVRVSAALQREMEDNGLVILSEESMSPVILEAEHEPDIEMKTNNQSEGSIEEEEEESSEEQSSDSSTETDQESEDAESIREESPPMVATNHDVDEDIELQKDTLPPYLPAIQGCRSVEEFQCLNRIEEGTYGVVYRARDKRTEDIVALKRLKMEKEKDGFPITSLREINTLLKAQHPNIVTVREIVVGSNMDKIFIVMDYVEHDLKALMETMKHKKQVFIPGEVKCLMQQLLSAVAHLHDNWILHRDLKASNLLLSHKGILKVGDFGLAREYGSPLKPYTPIVVTLWYRCPELLLCAKEYSTPVDMWSVGCIFAELLSMEPLFTGKSEVDQLNRIFKTLGTPNERVWPGYSKLPAVQKMTFTEFPVSQLRTRFSGMLSDTGLHLLNRFLTYNPAERVTAEEASKHDYFKEQPLPIDPAMFPTWPAKSEGHRSKFIASPKPPSGGKNYKDLGDTDEGFHMGAVERSRIALGPGFSLKF